MEPLTPVWAHLWHTSIGCHHQDQTMRTISDLNLQRQKPFQVVCLHDASYISICDLWTRSSEGKKSDVPILAFELKNWECIPLTPEHWMVFGQALGLVTYSKHNCNVNHVIQSSLSWANMGQHWFNSFLPEGIHDRIPATESASKEIKAHFSRIG